MPQVIYESESLTLRRPIVDMRGSLGLLAVLVATPDCTQSSHIGFPRLPVVLAPTLPVCPDSPYPNN
jgi:hypothetical protein